MIFYIHYNCVFRLLSKKSDFSTYLSRYSQISTYKKYMLLLKVLISERTWSV